MDLPARLGVDPDSVAKTGYVYAGDTYIEDNPDDARGKYYLLIERTDWISNDLEELEVILWAMAAMTYIHFDPAFYEQAEDGGPLISGEMLDTYIVAICTAFKMPVDGDLFAALFSGDNQEVPIDRAFRMIVDAIELQRARPWPTLLI
ncbi:hypothetical protein [Phyllobacterium zundukense]|uniref:Uncharacterized protein n=1 Tax=Phyllobacterium zundukense TaxID=1867719 RepID=A0A2N9W390_9HYPH|nr:hypothetical protein [Phyllobacterium zundukense]ATU94412.1 hypothetical protein BLM14_22015 [Phyllobacterium zundukense]PIO46208.1 hypothetical protein B5P45_03630 [Phyllobacterium zundukense]